jgi:hypothetical protein
MCEPTTIALAAGAGVSLVGAASSASAQSKEAAYNAKLAEQNQQRVELAAADARDRGEREVGLRQLQAGQLRGKQRLALAASGVDIQSGTALDVMEDSAASAAVDSATLRNNAAREAYGYKTQALQIGEQAKLDALKSSNQQTATLLGGVTGAATQGLKAYGAGKGAGLWGGTAKPVA